MLRDTTSRGLFVRVWPPHTTKTKDLTLVTRRGDCLWSLEDLLSSRSR